MAYVNNPAAYVPAAAAAAAAAAAVAQGPPPQQPAPPPHAGHHGSAAATPNSTLAAGTQPGIATHGAGSATGSLALLNMSNLINQKDSRWLQLEVCREFQRNKCSRSDSECKFAHPTSNVEVQNGRVTACYDSIKGRCNREKPPCKYFHPPQHLKDQLLINGRNHLALKNALMQQMGYMSQPALFGAGQFPSINSGYVAAFPHATPGYIPSPLQSPYLTSPLAHINPAMMSLFPAAAAAAAVTSPTTVAAAAEHQSAAAMAAVTMAASAEHTSRSVQMQAALLPTATGMSVHSQFQQHPAAHQLTALTHQHKAKAAGGSVEMQQAALFPNAMGMPLYSPFQLQPGAQQVTAATHQHKAKAASNGVEGVPTERNM